MLTILPRPRSGIGGESTNDEAYGVLPGEDRLVKDLMIREVSTVDASFSVNKAVNKISHLDLAILVVCQNGEPVLALTQYDLAIYQGSPGSVTLREMLETRTVIRCREDAILADAIRGMVDHRARQVPVVDAKGKLVGALSLVDAIGALTPEAATTWLPKIRQLSAKAPESL